MDATINELPPHLTAGDIIIDGGNSYYVDDIRRARELAGRSGGESLASIGLAGPDGHIVVRVGIDGDDNV